MNWNIDKVVDRELDSFVHYPMSWGYSISLVALRPLIDAVMPILTQGLALFFYSYYNDNVEWLRNRMNVDKSVDNKKAMDILNDLDEKLSRRKDFNKKEKRVKE